MSAAPVPTTPVAAPPVTGLFSNAVIVSYEGHEGPFNTLIVDDLTDYFWGISGQTVHTYLCVKDVSSYDWPSKCYRNYAPIVNTPL